MLIIENRIRLWLCLIIIYHDIWYTFIGEMLDFSKEFKSELKGQAGRLNLSLVAPGTPFQTKALTDTSNKFT